jgi:hypothetical protein
MIILTERCEEFNVDEEAVTSLARRMSKLLLEADKLGLLLFGASGTPVLRKKGGGAQFDVAVLDGHCDGGDGGDEY